MRRRRRTSNPLKLAVLGSLAAAALGGFIFVTLQVSGQKQPDKFGCFADVYARQSIVILDASEPRWDAAQQRALTRRFKQVYDGLEFNERLSIFTSEGDQVASVMTPRLSVCGAAHSPDQLAEIGAAGASKGFLEKQKQRLFEKHLKPELDVLLRQQADETRKQDRESPVFELIRSVVRTTRPENGDRMIVITDGIQNSDSLKFCEKQNDMPAFSSIKKKRIYRERLKPASLAGVEVEFLMLLRPGYGTSAGLQYCYSEEEIRAVWRDYFTDNGTEQPDFIRVRYGRG